MKIILILGLVFLLVFSVNGVTYAQIDGGNTVINTTVGGIWELRLSLQYTDIIVPENHSFYENLDVFQENSQNITVYLNKTDTNGFLKFVNGGYQDNHTIYGLAPNIHENVSLRVLIPPGMGFDNATYNVSVHGYSQNDSRSNTTILKIRVNNTSPIEGVDIINIYPSSLYQGESLTANISIHKIFPNEAADIQVCYCVDANPTYQCGPSLNDYGCEWKTVKEWMNYTKTITVSEGPGSYYFMAAAKYPGDVDVTRALSPGFLVKKIPGPPGGGPGGGVPGAPGPSLSIVAPDFIEAAPGERILFNVEIRNTGNANASGTTLEIYGVPENWVSVIPPEHDILIGESKNYSVFIYLPFTAMEQLYSLSLVGRSGTAETTREVSLTVAMTLEKQARLLLDGAKSTGEEAAGMIEKTRLWGMDTSEPEGMLASGDALLENAEQLFSLNDYRGAIEKAKEAIDAYKSAISSVNAILEDAYITLLENIILRLKSIENLTEEKNTIESIKDKINQGNILLNEGRFIAAYQTIMEAEQLLDQLAGKSFFRELTQNIIIISILVVIVVAAVLVIFYKKKMSSFLKTIRIEEHKKSLKKLFEREVRPGVTYKEKPKIDQEKLGEIRRLLEIGETFSDTDVDGARDVYVKAREIYDSLSADEKRLMLRERERLVRLYNRVVKKTR